MGYGMKDNKTEGMKYLAHKSDQGDEQTLKEHLENVAALCGEYAECFGACEMGYCCGLMHDIGKYSKEFQERIRGSEIRTDHSTAGAKVCWERRGLYALLSYCIAGHHAGLPDTGGAGDTGSRGTLSGRMRKKVDSYQEYEKEVGIPPINIPDFQPLSYQTVKQDQAGFFLSLMIKMLFSCLVDADYMDTERFMTGGINHRISGDSIDVLYERLNNHIAEWLNNHETHTINGRRTEILKNCLEMGDGEKGLFRLTVPTGGGKTVASLAFALTHAKKHKMDRVIYVIPYTSIIEQNASIFRDILGEDNVLENHCNVEYESEEELNPMQLAAENWDKPVIVTTNVQFFESIFSNKPSKTRKIHNITNSVIIFDEAQMLPNDYLKPCIAVIEQLVCYYRSTVVLCTATQPALKKLFSTDIKIKELCPRMEEQFRFFKRVNMENLNKISEEELIERLEKETQVLCILNRKKRVQEIYEKIKEEGVFHLSTAMYPAHRKRILCRIRERLEKRERCIVISTSLVEAGVDLDFATVFRQMAGVDSIIQAAGRCNREGKRPVEESKTYVFQFDKKEYVPGQRKQMEVAECLLEDGNNPEDLKIIQYYFEMLYHFRGDGLDKKHILEVFKPNDFPFAKVSKEFRLIEENTRTILITREEEAKNIYEELKIRGITKKLMRKMGKYCVNVYENEFQKMFAAGMLREISEDMKENYFVLREPEKYTEEMGLPLDIEYGRAVMF